MAVPIQINIANDKTRKRTHDVSNRLNRSIGPLEGNEARLPHGFAARPSFERASRDCSIFLIKLKVRASGQLVRPPYDARLQDASLQDVQPQSVSLQDAPLQGAPLR